MDNVGYSCNVDTPYPTHNQDRNNREAKSKKYERLEKQLEELAKGTNSLDELAEKVSESQYTISRDKTTGNVYNIKPKGSKIDRTKTDQNVYLKVPGYNNPDEFVKNGCKLPPKVWKPAYGEYFKADIGIHNQKQIEKGHPERANLTVDNIYDKDWEKQKNNTKAKIKSPMRSVLLQYGGEHDDIDLNDPEYRERACKALQETYKKITEQIPEKYIFQATIHMDESTPHLHLVLLPIAKASGHREHTPNFTKFMEKELGLKPEKSIIPNKDGSEKEGENVLNTFRNNFIRIMNEVGREYGFNREDKHTIEHKNQEEYKKYDNIIKGKKEEAKEMQEAMDIDFRKYDKELEEKVAKNKELETKNQELDNNINTKKATEEKLNKNIETKNKENEELEQKTKEIETKQKELVKKSEQEVKNNRAKIIKENIETSQIKSEIEQDFNTIPTKKYFGKEYIAKEDLTNFKETSIRNGQALYLEREEKEEVQLKFNKQEIELKDKDDTIEALRKRPLQQENNTLAKNLKEEIKKNQELEKIKKQKEATDRENERLRTNNTILNKITENFMKFLSKFKIFDKFLQSFPKNELNGIYNIEGQNMSMEDILEQEYNYANGDIGRDNDDYEDIIDEDNEEDDDEEE